MKRNKDMHNLTMFSARIVACLAIAFMFVECERHSVAWKSLDDAEAAMEKRPDSAMAIIHGIDTASLRGDEKNVGKSEADTGRALLNEVLQ